MPPVPTARRSAVVEGARGPIRRRTRRGRATDRDRGAHPLLELGTDRDDREVVADAAVNASLDRAGSIGTGFASPGARTGGSRLADGPAVASRPDRVAAGRAEDEVMVQPAGAIIRERDGCPPRRGAAPAGPGPVRRSRGVHARRKRVGEPRRLCSLHSGIAWPLLSRNRQSTVLQSGDVPCVGTRTRVAAVKKIMSAANTATRAHLRIATPPAKVRRTVSLQERTECHTTSNTRWPGRDGGARRGARAPPRPRRRRAGERRARQWEDHLRARRVPRAGRGGACHEPDVHDRPRASEGLRRSPTSTSTGSARSRARTPLCSTTT